MKDENFLDQIPQNPSAPVPPPQETRPGINIAFWIVGVFFVLMAVSGVIWAVFGKTIGSLVAIQYLERENGALMNTVPTPRTLVPATPAASTSFSYAGFTVSAPWGAVSSTQKSGNLEAIVFAGGQKITLMKAAETNPQNAAQLYEAFNISNDYELEEAAYNALPNEVSITTPGNQAVLTSTLLTYKLSIIVPDNGALYQFDTGTVKGFQHGDPVQNQWMLTELYGKDGNKYTLSTMNATQPEIDYILASIR